MGFIERNIEVGLIVREEQIAGIGDQIERSGGVVIENSKPYDPPADEVNDYVDARRESLMLIDAKLSVTMLIRLLSEALGEYGRLGGQIIDVSGKLPLCRPAPFLEPGVVVLITSEGLAVYEPERKIEALEAIEALFKKNVFL